MVRHSVGMNWACASKVRLPSDSTSRTNWFMSGPSCVRMAKAWAFLNGRSYVVPEDVADIFLDVCKHRIVLNTKARISHVTPEAVLNEILSGVERPASYKEKAGYRD